VKEGSSRTPLNGIVNYSLSVTNKGPDTATNLQVADPAPAGITYLTANPSQGTCNLGPALVTCALGTIAPGQTVTIAITGRHFYCSLLLFEACRILARLARILGLESEAGRHEQQADRIRSNLDLFWSADDALYLAGSQDCRQADVWGSAYACVIGALPEARRKEVARSLGGNRDRFPWRGHVRPLLLPEFWQRLTVESDYTGPNQFQNGPYWGTATGWMAEAFESVQPGEGFALLHDLIADFEMNGIWECIGPDAYQRIANNVSSAALPYASYKRLLQRPA